MLSVLARRAAPWLKHAGGASAAPFGTSSWALKPPPTPQPVPISKMYDNFLDGTSSTYLEELERRYQEDPESVDKTWAGFFRSVGAPTPRLQRPNRGIVVSFLIADHDRVV
jgi:2-oxoglutarate dehydrogenase N-terminus